MNEQLEIVGVIVLFAGVAACLFPQQVCGSGSCVIVNYPYLGLGTALIVLSIFVLVVGRVTGQKTAIRFPVQPEVSSAVGPGTAAACPQPKVNSAADPLASCVGCGEPLRSTDAFCPQCGRPGEWQVITQDRLRASS